MRFRRLVIVLGACLTLLGGLAAEAQQKDRVVLRLDWVVGGSHAPFFVALDKGFYQQENLAVTIREGRGSSVTVQTVAAGVDHFGWADFGVLAVAVVKGLPVKGIAGVIQKGTAGIITLQESGIKKP